MDKLHRATFFGIYQRPARNRAPSNNRSIATPAGWLAAAALMAAFSLMAGCGTPAGGGATATPEPQPVAGAKAGHAQERSTPSPRATNPAAAASPAAAPMRRPFAPDDKDLQPSLPVNARCEQVRGDRESVPYASGGCDAQGRPDGMAGARMSRDTLVEGVYIGGRFMPGAVYRTVTRFTDGGSASMLLSCTDMRPQHYDKLPVNTYWSDMNWIGTASTVCKAWRQSDGRNAESRQLFWMLQADADGAIVQERGGARIAIKLPVRQHALHTMATATRSNAPISWTEVIGTAQGSYRVGEPPEYVATGGSVRRKFYDVVYVESARQGQHARTLCVEGGSPQACVRADACTLNPLVGTTDRFNFDSRASSCPDGRLPGQPIRLDDGSVFTPTNKAGVGVFFRVDDRLSRTQVPVRRYRLGDALEIVPIEGTLKSPDGKVYSGRFINGEPI